MKDVEKTGKIPEVPEAERQGQTEKLWQQLWACMLRLGRELQEEPYELCWQRPQDSLPPFRLLQPANTSEIVSENSGPTAPLIGKTDCEAIVEVAEMAEVITSRIETVIPRARAIDENRAIGGRASTPSSNQTVAAAKAVSWRAAILQCQACNLGQEDTQIRQQAIIGYPEQRLLQQLEQFRQLELLLVCDVPNYDADCQNLPLAIESLEYLGKWLEAIQLAENYYLCNLVKCRTPGNRAAWPEEIKSCSQHLEQQLQFFQPKAILALGSSAARSLSRQRSDLDTLRSRQLAYPFQNRNIALFVTYSVAEVLQNPNELRKLVWGDLKRLRTFLQSSA